MSFFKSLKAQAVSEWLAYTEHPFTTAMADGTLPEAAFRFYLVQDYLFLIEFARAYAVAVYKAPTLADMREASSGLDAILDVEMDLHVTLCAAWGLSAEAIWYVSACWIAPCPFPSPDSESNSGGRANT